MVEVSFIGRKLGTGVPEERQLPSDHDHDGKQTFVNLHGVQNDFLQS
jgi:hypothetical protein